jgi:glycosyltransferase involved in cell wall biosynthesis
MKIIQIINVDFALRHFVLPLMIGERARGHTVIGVCADGPHLEPVRALGFRTISVPMARSLSLSAQWRALRALLAVLREEQPDMVHCHMPISGLLGRLAARLTGVRMIAYTCHGYLFNQPGPWWRRALSLGLEFVGGRLTDRYFTVSTEEAADARRLWIARDAIAIGNGRDPAKFHPDRVARDTIRAHLGVPAKKIVVCVVSRLVRHKGHPELLAAMERVPDAELWVVGERLPSDHGPDLAPLFAASPLGPRLRLLGYRDDIPALLAAADIFALPSHFEGLPMSVIEAMLSGLPVVATDVRGPREQVIDRVTGLLVPPRQVAPLADAIRRLVDDANLRLAMGRAGLTRALECYDEAQITGRTLDLLGL